MSDSVLGPGAGPYQVLGPGSGPILRARKMTRPRGSRAHFVAEGPGAVREALRRTGCVVEVFVSSAPSARAAAVVALRAEAERLGIAVRSCDERAIAKLSDTRTPQGVVAVCRTLDAGIDTIPLARSTLLAICADIRDPGNAGAVIRCADAAGADAVIFAGDSVDVYNGKAVRASAGSLFHLPVVTGTTVGEVVAIVRDAGLAVLAADASGISSLADFDIDSTLGRPTAWLFGNEAWGLPASVRDLADAVVSIPIYGAAESLNLATAVAVCLYASARAQRVSPPPRRADETASDR